MLVGACVCVLMCALVGGGSVESECDFYLGRLNNVRRHATTHTDSSLVAADQKQAVLVRGGWMTVTSDL